jgi:hypothetical protein
MTYSKTSDSEYCYYFTHPTGPTVSYFTCSGFKTNTPNTGYHKEADARLLAKRHPHLTMHRV